MNARTLFLFLFGNAAAIRRVASSPAAVPLGILLVLSAGVARNYDQMWFGESPMWLLGPLAFSTVSGLWLYLWVASAWKGREERKSSEPGKVPEPPEPPEPPASAGSADPPYFPDFASPLPSDFEKFGLPVPPEFQENASASPRLIPWRRLASFYGLFWMTAPTAWLYALPVERWCDPMEAARWNIRLLGVVALWRVLVMARALMVISEWPFHYALARVLLPATLETVAVTFFGKLAGISLMRGMAGLRSSPVEEVTIRAYNTVVAASGILLIFVLGFLAVSLANTEKRLTPPWRPQTMDRRWQMPWLFLTLITAFWVMISRGSQREQWLSEQANQFAKKNDWPAFVELLSAHQQSDFAPSRPLPPAVYEYGSWTQISELFGKLSPETPVWIRDHAISALDKILSMPEYARHLEEGYLLRTIAITLEQLPEGPDVLRRHAEVFEKIAAPIHFQKLRPGDPPP